MPTSTYDAANQQLGFGGSTHTFDPNGNLLTQTDPSGTITYNWDARNRLVGIGGPSVNATSTYDALGRRIGKTENGQGKTFHYDGLDIIREAGDTGGAAYLRTLAIDEALSRTDISGFVTCLAGVLGSTVALADANGTPVTEYTYEPFSVTSVSGLPSSNPFRFTGRENDGAGLYFYRARCYASIQSRFVQEDLIGLVGGVNFYVYVENAPLMDTDPFGLQSGPPGLGPAPSPIPPGTPGAPVSAPHIGSLAMQVRQVAGAWGLSKLLDEISEKMDKERARIACGQTGILTICWTMTLEACAARNAHCGNSDSD